MTFFQIFTNFSILYIFFYIFNYIWLSFYQFAYQWITYSHNTTQLLFTYRYNWCICKMQRNTQRFYSIVNGLISLMPLVFWLELKLCFISRDVVTWTKIHQWLRWSSIWRCWLHVLTVGKTLNPQFDHLCVAINSSNLQWEFVFL